MKRRFPGDQPGPPSRPHDPRFTGRGGGGGGSGGGSGSGSGSGSGGGGPPPMNAMGRGPAAGRFQARGGPRHPNFPGRGPPGPMMGRGGRGRGPPPQQHMQGRGPPPMRGGSMDRGMHQRHPQPPFGHGPPMGRGPPPGRGPPMGRGPMPPGPRPHIPPPPPRGGPMGGPLGRHPHGERMPYQPPPRHHVHGRPPPGIPPPPMRPGFSNQHPPPLAPPPMVNLPPPPFPQQRLQQGMGPPIGFSTPVATGYSSFPAPAGVVPVVPRANIAVATTKVPTQQQIDDAWKEYTGPGGIKYYHNPFLTDSTYTKPAALSKNDVPALTQQVPKRQWQEYEDAPTGKKYYSDGTTTTWEKPGDFQSPSQIIEKTQSVPPAKKRKKAALKESPYSSKEETITAFKGLLLAKGIAPIQKWNDVAKYCSSDARWEPFDKFLSVGERRQALAEYQTKRANELRNQERQERIRAKDAYGQLLTDVLPTVSGFSSLNSRFAEVRSTLAKDDRFHAVAEEGTRESLFLDFCEEFRKRDERKKRNKKRGTQETFLSFLSEKEEVGALTFASTWDSFFVSLDETDKDDSRFKTSPLMSDSDRQLYFADFVIELQAAEDDKRRRIRDARRRAEKAQREAYRDLLKQMASEGRIRPYTRWRSIDEFVAAAEAFSPIQAQDRDAPRELFEEFVDEWDVTYRRERSFLARLLNPPDKEEISVKGDTSMEDFTKLLLKAAEYSSDVYGDTRQIINREEPLSTARLYFEELISRANSDSQGHASRRLSLQEESSEDEGEIVEEGEVNDKKPAKGAMPADQDDAAANVDAQSTPNPEEDGAPIDESKGQAKGPTANDERELANTKGDPSSEGTEMPNAPSKDDLDQS